MFMYKFCNFIVASDEIVSELSPVSGNKADIRVKRIYSSESFYEPSSWFMQWHHSSGKLWLSFAKVVGGYLLRFNELADFLVNNDGNEIDFTPKHGVPTDTIQHLLLDQVIPLVINLRGGEALHASSVLTSHGVVAFAGPAGSGKSTLAGSFFQLGYPIFSDDCLALVEQNPEIYGLPAYPGLRLWEDAVLCLFGGNGDHKSVAHYTNKLRVAIRSKQGIYCKEPKPLKRLYDIVPLSDDEVKGKTGIIIEPLSPQDSFMALVRCAFRLDITDQSMLKRQFHSLEKVASKVSVRRLIFPRDFNLLPAVREAILKDLQGLNN
jgi:hypothetical protein